MRRVLGVLAALLAGLVWAAPAPAQPYPSRVVTIIVPYPAGGPTDQLARVLAPALSERLGQSFIVENVSGGATTIATGRVARAAGDGYSLIVDGTGAVDGEQLRVEPTSAVLHRTPAGDPDAPSCITVLGRT